MKEIKADAGLVACCGLYCGACGSYLKGKCQGCAGNTKASWCKVRTCCNTRKFATCADCGDFAAFEDCSKLNNFISRIISLFTKSDRPACLRRIKQTSCGYFAAEMAEARSHAIKKR